MWLDQFLLGRPGYEMAFDVNPESLSIEDAPIVNLSRNAAGDLRKSTFKASAPLIRINSTHLPKSQRDQLSSIVSITDTFLSFKTRDDWQVIDERDVSNTYTQIQVQNSSATRLSAVLTSLGFSSTITVTSVKAQASGDGYGAGGYGLGGYGGGGLYGVAEYYTAGSSYDDATRTIMLATPLPFLNTEAFVTYTYTGWLVNLSRFYQGILGGWKDRFTYDFELMGV